jgi:hypothetical protein
MAPVAKQLFEQDTVLIGHLVVNGTDAPARAEALILKKPKGNICVSNVYS